MDLYKLGEAHYHFHERTAHDRALYELYKEVQDPTEGLETADNQERFQAVEEYVMNALHSSGTERIIGGKPSYGETPVVPVVVYDQEGEPVGLNLSFKIEDYNSPAGARLIAIFEDPLQIKPGEAPDRSSQFRYAPEVNPHTLSMPEKISELETAVKYYDDAITRLSDDELRGLGLSEEFIAGSYTLLGEVAKKIGRQTQYTSYYLTGIAGYPNLGEGLDYQDDGNYHAIKIKRSDVDEFVRRFMETR